MVNDWLHLWYTKTYGRPAAPGRKRDFAARGERLERRPLFSLVAVGNFDVGQKPRAIAGADFDRDGKLDLAVANEVGNSVSLLLGNGDGTFKVAQNFGSGGSPS